jgi:hypothetical protein
MLANFVFFLIFFLFKIINIIITERVITAIKPTPKPNCVTDAAGVVTGTEVRIGVGGVTFEGVDDTIHDCDSIGFPLLSLHVPLL